MTEMKKLKIPFLKNFNNSDGRLVKFLAVFSVGLGSIFLIKRNDWFRAVVFLFVGPLFLLLPRYLYQKKWAQRYNLQFLSTIESFALPLFILPSLGSLGLYRTKLEYDSLVHAITPIFISILVAFLLTYHKTSFSKGELLKISLSVFFLTMFLCVLWEFFEWYADKFLGTGMLAGLNQPLNIDTIWDLITDAIGALFGSILVWIKWPKWQAQWLRQKDNL